MRRSATSVWPRTRLLKRYHPDKGGDSDSDADREHWTSATAEVNAAWDVLKDARKRAEYDAYRSARARGGDEPSDPPPGPDSSDPVAGVRNGIWRLRLDIAATVSAAAVLASAPGDRGGRPPPLRSALQRGLLPRQPHHFGDPCRSCPARCG